MMLGNIPTEWLFSSYEECLNYAADLYKEEISINTSTTMESLPYGLRCGDIDPLVDLINEFLISKEDLIGIQIGSYAGESTSLFLRSGVFKTLYAIDPWECGYDNSDSTSDKRLIAAEQMFDKHFKDNKIIKKIKAKSSDVIDQFEDESLDFIYIDGCHTYKAVKEDLNNYVPKIKKGGIIAGHDYDITGSVPHIIGVKKAIDEYFGKAPLKTYKDNSWVYIKD